MMKHESNVTEMPHSHTSSCTRMHLTVFHRGSCPLAIHHPKQTK